MLNILIARPLSMAAAGVPGLSGSDGGTEGVRIHKGLDGVIIDKTSISSVGAGHGTLTYRGYPVAQMARLPFETTAFLLLHERLPSATETTAYTARLA